MESSRTGSRRTARSALALVLGALMIGLPVTLSLVDAGEEHHGRQVHDPAGAPGHGHHDHTACLQFFASQPDPAVGPLLPATPIAATPAVLPASSRIVPARSVRPADLPRGPPHLRA